jgi:hypothetical protein
VPKPGTEVLRLGLIRKRFHMNLWYHVSNHGYSLTFHTHRLSLLLVSSFLFIDYCRRRKLLKVLQNANQMLKIGKGISDTFLCLLYISSIHRLFRIIAIIDRKNNNPNILQRKTEDNGVNRDSAIVFVYSPLYIGRYL